MMNRHVHAAYWILCSHNKNKKLYTSENINDRFTFWSNKCFRFFFFFAILLDYKLKFISTNKYLYWTKIKTNLKTFSLYHERIWSNYCFILCILHLNRINEWTLKANNLIQWIKRRKKLTNADDDENALLT